MLAIFLGDVHGNFLIHSCLTLDANGMEQPHKIKVTMFISNHKMSYDIPMSSYNMSEIGKNLTYSMRTRSNFETERVFWLNY